MQTVRQPYEFLVRWDRQGRLAGAHAQFRLITTATDGSVVADILGNAEPVAVAGAAGFPLADVLSQAQAAALAALEAVTAERDALASRLAALSAPSTVPA